MDPIKSLIHILTSLPLIDQVKFFAERYETLTGSDEPNSNLLQELTLLHSSDGIDKGIEFLALKVLISRHEYLTVMSLQTYSSEKWHCAHQWANFVKKCQDLDESFVASKFVSNEVARILIENCNVECQRHCPCASIRLVTTILGMLVDGQEDAINFDLIANMKLTKKCISRRRIELLIAACDYDSIHFDEIRFLNLHIKFIKELSSSTVNWTYVVEQERMFSTPSNEDINPDKVDADLIFLLIKIASGSKQLMSQEKESKLELIKEAALITDEIIVTKMYIEDDEKLINVCLFLIKIYATVHLIAEAVNVIDNLVTKVIHSDASVLIDWLISDKETSIPLIELLITFLKIGGVKEHFTGNIKSTFGDLLVKLTTNKSLPFNVDPLIRLLKV